MDDFEVDGTIYRREPDAIDLAFAEEFRKAFLSVASPPPRKPRKTTPDGLNLPPQAASKLNVTVEQLMAFVRDGELRYINIGRGSKRPRYAFTDTDIVELIEKRQTREVQCLSTGPRNPRRISDTTSKSVVSGFTARRAAQIAAKPKK
jgi:hypothetical protein